MKNEKSMPLAWSDRRYYSRRVSIQLISTLRPLQDTARVAAVIYAHVSVVLFWGCHL